MDDKPPGYRDIITKYAHYDNPPGYRDDHALFFVVQHSLKLLRSDGDGHFYH